MHIMSLHVMSGDGGVSAMRSAGAAYPDEDDQVLLHVGDRHVHSKRYSSAGSAPQSGTTQIPSPENLCFHGLGIAPVLQGHTGDVDRAVGWWYERVLNFRDLLSAACAQRHIAERCWI